MGFSHVPWRYFRAFVALAISLVASVILLTGASAVPGFGPASSPSSTCTISWNNVLGGNWSTPGDWTPSGPPASTDDVCITLNGTYSVVTPTGSAVSVHSLNIGGASGTQTLQIASTCSVNASVTTTAGATINANGVVELTNGAGCATNASLVGPITNNGTILSSAAIGGARNLLGNLTNTGTITINQNTTFNSAATTLDNKGTVAVADTKALSVSSSASFTNDTGGSLSATGTGVLTETGGTFSQGPGAITGSRPVVLDNVALKYTGAGASSIVLRGSSSTLAGNLAVGQNLTLESTCSDHALVTAAVGFTNAGAIVLTNGDGCGNNATISLTTGALTNSGTIQLTAATGGNRSIVGTLANSNLLQINQTSTLTGSLTNTGTVNETASTAFNGSSATLDNLGTITLATGSSLNLSNNANFTNDTGGTITAAGTGVITEHGGTFTQGAIAIGGTRPVVLDDATLTTVGSGAANIAIRGSSTLNGSLASGQNLTIESTCSENAVVTSASSFSSAATIFLTNGDGCGNNATLVVTSGTLTSSGTITLDPAHGGSRTIQGNLTNTGTFQINTSSAFSGGGTIDNQGSVAIANGAALALSGGTSFTNDVGGTIAATGTGILTESGGTFSQGPGAITGTRPVVLDNVALTYTGVGASSIVLRGSSSTLAGNLASGQTLTIESTCSENAVVTAAVGFANAGAIVLTNGDGCGNNAKLALTTGTLTNSGTITLATAIGGNRSIIGDVVNFSLLQIDQTSTLTGNLNNVGTINENASTAFNGSGANLGNEGGKITLANGSSLNLTNNANFFNDIPVSNVAPAGIVSFKENPLVDVFGAITATGTGVITEHGGTFTQGPDAIVGTRPVVLDDATLTLVGFGAANIAIRGSSTVNVGGGLLMPGQNLTIESTCSENASLTSAGFTNNATIVLTNGDACGDNASLVTSAGTLTNGGTITVAAAIGGGRTIQGNLTNTGIIQIDRNTSFPGANTLLNHGTISIADGVTLSAPNSPTISDAAGGSIQASSPTGTGLLSQSGGTFNLSGGTTIGTEPVLLDRVTLNDLVGGAATVHLRGSSTLTGNISKGQILQIESTCGEHAVATEPGSFGNAGTIILTNGDGCANNVTLTLTGVGTLTNTGTVQMLNPHGGIRAINGNLSSSKSVLLDAGNTLQVNGTYTQTSTASIGPTIHVGSSVGLLTASGAATIAGAVAPTVTGSKPTAGQSFTFLHGSSVTGTFDKVTKGGIGKKGLYFDPTYTATSASLLVTQAANTAPHSAARGSSILITGTSWAANDSIQITFTDSLGVKTTYTTITADPTGAFSTNVTIPLGAATGVGKITITSLFDGAVMTDKITIS